MRARSAEQAPAFAKTSADKSRLSCIWGAAISALIVLFPTQPAVVQGDTLLQYKLQPHQTFRYRLDLQHEVKVSDGASQAQNSPSGLVGQNLPITTKIAFQVYARIVEVDSVGVATLEARAEKFSARTTTGSKEIVSPASAVGQAVQFRIGSYGLVPGQEALSNSSGLPWGLFLSQVFPDLTRCRYLGPAVFNGQPCAKIDFDLTAPPSMRPEKNSAVQTRDYNQGKGTGLFADGRLLSGETQGSVDLGYSAKSTFSSRLSLLP